MNVAGVLCEVLGTVWGTAAMVYKLTKVLRAVTLAGKFTHPDQCVEVAFCCKCHT